MELVAVALGVGAADDMCVGCVEPLPIVDRIYSGRRG